MCPTQRICFQKIKYLSLMHISILNVWISCTPLQMQDTVLKWLQLCHIHHHYRVHHHILFPKHSYNNQEQTQSCSQKVT